MNNYIRQCPAHCNYMSTAYVGDIVKVSSDGSKIKQAVIPADRITTKKIAVGNAIASTKVATGWKAPSSYKGYDLDANYSAVVELIDSQLQTASAIQTIFSNKTLGDFTNCTLTKYDLQFLVNDMLGSLYVITGEIVDGEEVTNHSFNLIGNLKFATCLFGADSAPNFEDTGEDFLLFSNAFNNLCVILPAVATQNSDIAVQSTVPAGPDVTITTASTKTTTIINLDDLAFLLDGKLLYLINIDGFYAFMPIE